MVNKYGTLDFPQLRDAFPDVSDVTLRKDLQYLDSTKQAIRTHGGIKSIPSALNYIYRANVNQDKKQAIAVKAARLIQPGDSVFLSAGTSCAELARCLPVFKYHACGGNFRFEPAGRPALFPGVYERDVHESRLRFCP